MASPEVLHTPNDSGSFPSDDYSFLPEVEVSSSEYSEKGSVNQHNHENFDLTNMQSTLNSVSPDASVEVCSWFKDVFDENSRLKDQLHKTSSMMEDQIGTIQSWRDHMILTKNQLEESLKIANKTISSLEMQNSELCEKIEDLKKENDQKNKSYMQCSACEAETSNLLTLDHEKTDDHISHNSSYFKDNLRENLKFVCQQLEAISGTVTNPEEELAIKCYISMMKCKIASLENATDFPSLQTNEEAGYEVIHIKAHEGGNEQFHDVHEEFKKKLKDKDEQLTTLKNEKEQFLQKIKDHEQKMQEYETAMKSQVEILNNKLQIESCLVQKYRERCENFEKQVETDKKIAENGSEQPDNSRVNEFHEEIKQLQSILKLEHEEKEKEKEKYSILMEKCEKLQVDYDRVTQLLEVQRKDEKEKNEKLSLCEIDMKKYMEDADHLTAVIINSEEKLKESEDEIVRLKADLAKVLSDPTIVEQLKAQVVGYKIDVEELRQLRQKDFDEIQRLNNELEKYQKHRSHSESHSSGRSPRKRHSDQTGQAEAASILQCPICSMGFIDENSIQNHVQRCIQEN